MSELIAYSIPWRERLISLALAGVTSSHTRRAYAYALEDFLSWTSDQHSPFTKSLVQRYKQALAERHFAAATINQHLAAVRRLAQEAADNGMLDGAIAAAILRVRGVKKHGVRLGRWLSKESLEQLLAGPAPKNSRAIRDRVALALLSGGGLRRSEVTEVAVEQFRQIEGRWVIADLQGKHGRVRTVPIPEWVKACVDEWLACADIHCGKVLRRIRKGGHIEGDGLTPQAIYDICERWLEHVDPNASPHDLRRTFARVSFERGAPLDQLALSLGHASVATTERYVGSRQNFKTSARLPPVPVLPEAERDATESGHQQRLRDYLNFRNFDEDAQRLVEEHLRARLAQGAWPGIFSIRL